MATLFNAREGIDNVRSRRTERKATKSDNAARAYANSPHFQRVVEENKQLKSALHRIRALEKHATEADARLDQQEQWNTECELYVKKPQVPTVREVACRECRQSYPNYPAYWPGGFHGSTDPVCAYCKPGHEYVN